MPERGYYDHLTFNAPLADARADEIARRLAAAGPRDVLDIGCGWGELMLRVVEQAPGSVGTGLDHDERLLERGRRVADDRRLGERVRFLDEPVTTWDEPAELVLCIGSSQAFGSVPDALHRLRSLVRPGGRLLFGDGFWEPSGPVDESLVWDDVLDLPNLAGLVSQAQDAGYRPLYVEAATTAEWDAFESGYLADDEEWLLRNPDHPEADAVRAAADEHRDRWLRGYRNGLGFGYLTLGLPA
jgi:ubiquinone/menaquinone biosynthesis C-methylase UbiE